MTKEYIFYKLKEQFLWMNEELHSLDLVARIYGIGTTEFDNLITDNAMPVETSEDGTRHFIYSPKKGIAIVGFEGRDENQIDGYESGLWAMEQLEEKLKDWEHET